MAESVDANFANSREFAEFASQNSEPGTKEPGTEFRPVPSCCANKSRTQGKRCRKWRGSVRAKNAKNSKNSKNVKNSKKRHELRELNVANALDKRHLQYRLETDQSTQASKLKLNASSMKKLFERIVDTCRYNLGRVPEKEYYIEEHVWRGNCRVVETLFRGNPELTQYRDMFGTPLLIWAVGERQHEMSKLLLRLGCEVNAVDSDGASALHHAVLYEDLELVALLMAHGASPRIADRNGDVPMDWVEPPRKGDFQKIIQPSAALNGDPPAPIG